MLPDSNILTINSGSSSSKFSLYALGGTERLVLKGELAGIRVSQGFFPAEDHQGHQLGARATVLGGLDTFIFTGGIGENSATIRARIYANLEFLGIHLYPDLNQENAPIIAKPDSRVTVRVMKTNEELMIARHTRDRLTG